MTHFKSKLRIQTYKSWKGLLKDYSNASKEGDNIYFIKLLLKIYSRKKCQNKDEKKKRRMREKSKHMAKSRKIKLLNKTTI